MGCVTVRKKNEHWSVYITMESLLLKSVRNTRFPEVPFTHGFRPIGLLNPRTVPPLLLRKTLTAFSAAAKSRSKSLRF